jgi:pimeloyl-ACP methyl ester carboxylesterase
VDVHLATAGPPDAPPLLLLHGWPQHWWCWRRVVPLLTDFRLLVPDLRGVGWSGWPGDGDFRKDRLVDDALALLDALDIQRAGLIGHDWGAWAGFLAALRAPERFVGLLALGIVHPWQEPGRLVRHLPRFAYQLPLGAPVLGPQLMRRTPVVAAVHRAAWGDPATFAPEEVAPFTETYREPARAEAGSRLYRDFLLREVPANARGRFAGERLRIPTRLLFGEREPLGVELAEGLERHGDDAQVEILPGCGHFVPEERPAEVAVAARGLFA